MTTASKDASGRGSGASAGAWSQRVRVLTPAEEHAASARRSISALLSSPTYSASRCGCSAAVSSARKKAPVPHARSRTLAFSGSGGSWARAKDTVASVYFFHFESYSAAASSYSRASSKWSLETTLPARAGSLCQATLSSLLSFVEEEGTALCRSRVRGKQEQRGEAARTRRV